MVLPLLPLALIAAGSASGAGGLLLGGKGAAELKTARKSVKKNEARYMSALNKTERAVAATNDRLEAFGGEQEYSLKVVVLRMGDFLRRNAKQVKESERLLVDGIDVRVASVGTSARLNADAVAWVRGVIGSAATGVGVSTSVTAAVGTVGVASTGTAIAGLSGAAAESATMAFLGGGSLASGGGGVALGATALNFVAIGPAVLVGGFVLKGQGDKAKTQAREYEARVKVAVAEMSGTRSQVGVVERCIDELSDLLTKLTERAVTSLDVLESETFDVERHADRFQQSLNLAMAVRDVAATPVVDGAGELNNKTSGFSVKYRAMTEEPADD